MNERDSTLEIPSQELQSGETHQAVNQYKRKNIIMNNLSIQSLGAAIITTGLLTSALSSHAQAPDPNNEDRQTRFLERYDLDGNGEVTREEIQAVRAESAATRVANFMEKHDLDQNGVITADELILAASEHAAEKQTSLLEKYDLNGDGEITSAESLSVHEAAVDERIARILDRINGNVLVEEEEQAPEGRRPKGKRPNLDLDGDGEVTEGEVLVAGANMVIEMQTRFNERFDTDGNGTITSDEINNVSGAAVMEKVEELLAKLDTNEDGQITANEVSEGAPNRRGNRGPGRGPRPEATERGTDADTDGAPQRPQGRRGNGRPRR
ncbi:hypothetical protein OAG52_05245 [Verrucomicrobia bacterium]|nr:hypothetical protein [Verrucomicrobiota bacterium]